MYFSSSNGILYFLENSRVPENHFPFSRFSENGFSPEKRETLAAWHRHCTAQGWVGPNLPTLNNFLLFADREVDALVSGQLSRSGGEKKNSSSSNPRARRTNSYSPSVP
jgi:hypothetical protein